MSDAWRQRDIKHLWHPYTEITAFEGAAFPVIERAEGINLYEVSGRRLLDGISSWWCVNLGHSHPTLIAAIHEQAETLQHCILGGMSHPRAIELAERLAQLAPGGLNHAYFACDGSSAVEAALKMAIQYRVHIGQPKKNRFIGLAEGYHGDTLGAMGVGFVEMFHKDFEAVLTPAYQAVSPHCAKCPYGKTPETCDIECFASMEQLVRDHHGDVTAVILEPLCQGAGGIRIYPEEYLRRARALCDQYDILLIADEIAVGFGRVGAMFACERAGIAPDIMTLGKGLTGGYLPMSVAMVSDRIYDTFRADGECTRTFYDGHTYCGNPITSALALAALDVYEAENIPACLAPRIQQLAEGMSALKDLTKNSTGLTLGLIGALEVSDADGGANRARKIGQCAMGLGLFIRPLGPVVYLWPPLTTTPDELRKMLDLLKAAVEQTA